ncbi:thyroxine 5-deiodinase-like isoform X2 [Babylonia areolata]|uniref:thyroxine 5-deiodinase-like isoform X2 n=1 Tax=Babylonia areolata TaxID=304850 RepID=UPI003FD34204
MMRRLGLWRHLANSYGVMADFLFVYIEEAHPSDGWAFRNNPFSIREHRTLAERQAAAQQMLTSDPACDVVVDNMANEANFLYGALYERLFIVLDGYIVFVGERGPAGFRVDEVEKWLQRFKQG